MTDERLHAFRVFLTDNRLKAASQHHRQAEVVVAAATMKEAAAIIGCEPKCFTENGGRTGQKAVAALVLANPRKAFVEMRNGQRGEFRPLETIDDPATSVIIDLHDEELHGTYTDHPAFGIVELSRLSGGGDNLFMVDYPTGGSIALTISTARLNRNLANDRVFQEREITRIEMSEVQWARLVSSMNTQGVPVTLRRYSDPVTGDFMAPQMPDRHAGNIDTFRKEIEGKADRATRELKEAHDRLAEILKGPLRKGDLVEVLDLLRSARGAATNGLPFVAEQAHEAIDTAAEHAKAEIDAHIDHAMQRLGERALGSHLHAALESGVDISEVGRTVLQALNPPRPDGDPNPATVVG